MTKKPFSLPRTFEKKVSYRTRYSNLWEDFGDRRYESSLSSGQHGWPAARASKEKPERKRLQAATKQTGYSFFNSRTDTIYISKKASLQSPNDATNRFSSTTDLKPSLPLRVFPPAPKLIKPGGNQDGSNLGL